MISVDTFVKKSWPKKLPEYCTNLNKDGLTCFEYSATLCRSCKTWQLLHDVADYSIDLEARQNNYFDSKEN